MGSEIRRGQTLSLYKQVLVGKSSLARAIKWASWVGPADLESGDSGVPHRPPRRMFSSRCPRFSAGLMMVVFSVCIGCVYFLAVDKAGADGGGSIRCSATS
eukprot:2675294-Lingulodinium_polyedra.AAC.1